MEMKKRFDDAGFILNWESGINWYFASCGDLDYLVKALRTVLSWNDYDCENFIFKSDKEWIVSFHY